MSMIRCEFVKLVRDIERDINDVDYEINRAIKSMKEALAVLDDLGDLFDKLTTKDEEDTA